jgi:hypothetical protein
MFWGNSHAMAQSGGGAVFDTTDGFTGVWHLSGTGTAAHDATFNQYHGVANSATAVAPVSGIIGNARHFDGMSGFIDLPGTAAGNLNFEENGQYTLSAWVWVDSLRQPVDIGASQTIFSKGEQLYNLDLEWQSSQWHMSEYRSGIGVEQLQSELPAQTGVWKFVCGVRNGSSMALYVDGVLVNDRTFITPWPDSRNPSWNATIGKIADLNARYFDGILDEVIASGVARTPDWIKLCYMNQRIDNKLVIMYR